MDTTPSDIQRLARRAGVTMPGARAEYVAPALPGIEEGARRLAAVDYAHHEPSARFRAPAPEPR